MSTIDKIMACADRFAAESIEYNRHPHVKLEGMRDVARYDLKCMVRDELAQRDEEAAKLRVRLARITAALAGARREGAEEAMTEIEAQEPVGWQQRTLFDGKWSNWQDCNSQTANILRQREDYEVRGVYAQPIAAQAVLDGRRLEAERNTARGAVRELEQQVFTLQQQCNVLQTCIDSHQRDIKDPPGYLQDAVIRAAGLGALHEQRDAAVKERDALRAWKAEIEAQEPAAEVRTWHKSGDQHAELTDWCAALYGLPDGDHKLYVRPPVHGEGS